jgi:hypothetical protein
MSTWHTTPEYINDNWTEEQFLLLFKMRNRRIKHENGEPHKKKSSNMASDDFLAACGVKPVVVN